jgi:hypothetical protein
MLAFAVVGNFSPLPLPNSVCTKQEFLLRLTLRDVVIRLPPHKPESNKDLFKMMRVLGVQLQTHL